MVFLILKSYLHLLHFLHLLAYFHLYGFLQNIWRIFKSSYVVTLVSQKYVVI